MRFARTNLGLIPDWQFSTDPAVNPKLNPFVQWPAGVYQTTPQPIGPYYQGPNQFSGSLRATSTTASAVGWVVVIGGLGLAGWLTAKYVLKPHHGLSGHRRRRRR